MRAHTGDWLIVKGRTDSSAARRAMVLEAHGPDGSAPFLVRWVDSGHEAIVFPGPDAVIVAAADQSEHDRVTR
jgi:predicted dehydrogenase